MINPFDRLLLPYKTISLREIDWYEPHINLLQDVTPDSLFLVNTIKTSRSRLLRVTREIDASVLTGVFNVQGIPMLLEPQLVVYYDQPFSGHILSGNYDRIEEYYIEAKLI